MSHMVIIMPLPLPGSKRSSLIAAPLCVALLVNVFNTTAWCAEKAGVADAIKRSQAYLLKQPKVGPEGTLACYALIKSGIDKQHPDVLKQVQEIDAKCRTNGYQPTQHYNYEAGVDAMLLEAVDPVAYKPQLQLIANFLVAKQLPCGGWFYPSDERGRRNEGDTSITQYAVLGLWAASRAGVEVPIEVWEKTAQWLIQFQCPDGGFAYHPSEGRTSTITMTAAGTGTLLIIRRELYAHGDIGEPSRPAAAPATRRFGVLERVVDEPKPDVPKVKTSPTLSKSSVEKAIKDGVQWSGNHFGERSSEWVTYYYYG
ncbi:MAG: terpene cyclase/mutase family protein, partial [Candidatus Saccharimonas sp.]|nr:terpene cyclase/mutase family protein [Planctomycetaceae bacterium]